MIPHAISSEGSIQPFSRDFCIFLLFAQRAFAALLALCLRSSALSFLAVAFPPRLPSSTAAAFFLGTAPVVHVMRSGTQYGLTNAQRCAQLFDPD